MGRKVRYKSGRYGREITNAFSGEVWSSEKQKFVSPKEKTFAKTHRKKPPVIIDDSLREQINNFQKWNTSDHITIWLYTSFNMKSKSGSWGISINKGKSSKIDILHGTESNISKDELDLITIIKALESIDGSKYIKLYTPITPVYRLIKSNNPKREDNEDLWIKLNLLFEKHDINMVSYKESNTKYINLLKSVNRTIKKQIPSQKPLPRKPNETIVEIYTDGACRGNPGPGGWGAIICYRGQEREFSGGESKTTNNRMEMMAAIAALEALKQPCKICIFSDSRYLIDGITKWIKSWKKNNWKTAGKAPVKNEDLWRRLETATFNHEVNWKWVKGHSGNPMNERVDQLARSAIRRK